MYRNKLHISQLKHNQIIFTANGKTEMPLMRGFELHRYKKKTYWPLTVDLIFLVFSIRDVGFIAPMTEMLKWNHEKPQSSNELGIYYRGAMNKAGDIQWLPTVWNFHCSCESYLKFDSKLLCFQQIKHIIAIMN